MNCAGLPQARFCASAALQAAKDLRSNILDVAAAILLSAPEELDITEDTVVNIGDGAPRIELNYLVPMSGEMHDIHIGYVVSPRLESELGAKGAGEPARQASPAAAVANAVDDALRRLNTIITEIPSTPQVILTVLGRI